MWGPERRAQAIFQASRLAYPRWPPPAAKQTVERAYIAWQMGHEFGSTELPTRAGTDLELGLGSTRLHVSPRPTPRSPDRRSPDQGCPVLTPLAVTVCPTTPESQPARDSLTHKARGIPFSPPNMSFGQTLGLLGLEV